MRIFLTLLTLVLTVARSLAIDVPEGFVAQPLEATGGQIAMPKGWFCHQGQKGSEVVWIISKEDSKLAPYETGVKIQFFAAVKEHSGGKTAQEFCEAFLDNKRKTTKVLTTFPQRSQGMFTREGIEDQEDITESGVTKNYHIVYSAFWTNEKDMAVVMVAGAPSTLWSQYEKTFNVMTDFELLDMTKLPK